LAAFGDLADAKVANLVGFETGEVVAVEAITPERIGSMPAMARIREVLPAPLAPTMATISPIRTSSETAESAWASP
jgi:hypothetical protein